MLFDILLAVCAVYSLVASTAAVVHSHRWIKVPAVRGAAECQHCNRFIGKYFIDGHGRVTCAKCKPEGFADALKRKLVAGS